MDFKKGSWTPGKAFELNKVSDLLDNKAAKRIVDDLKLAMPPKPKQEKKDKIHNPIVKASDYGKKGRPGYIKSARKPDSQDQDLMSSMMNRLTEVEKNNKLLK